MNKISFFRNLMYKRRIRKEALLIKMPDKYKTASIEELFTKIKTFYQNKNYQEILFLEYYNKDYLKNCESEEIRTILKEVQSCGYVCLPNTALNDIFVVEEQLRKNMIKRWNRKIIPLTIFILYFYYSLNINSKSIKKTSLFSYITDFFVKKYHLIDRMPDRLKDVKAIDDVKEEIEEVISMLVDSSKFKKSGAKVFKGILLEGKPGTGKTMLARAIAGESKLNFIYVTGAELETQIVGGSSKNIKELFKFASKNQPCIIFIDEIDSLINKEKRDK